MSPPFDRKIITICLLVNACTMMIAHAFSPTSTASSITSTKLFMAPKYDKSSQLWSPTRPEEEASAGYGVFGSLLRQGPVPFVQRLKDPAMYEQAVLKMMASEGMDRNEAQGNMDAYLQNPNDWALQKYEEKNGAPKFDYANANMDPKQLVLTGLWSALLFSIAVRAVYVLTTGCDDFCQEYHI
mmetsp:Transcript_29216/g.42888  ORF Transcript_29216/g.42888 Transcript_29216/m.42888 type:complete len:184 (-) Transcript_29216:99-650(-)